MFKMVVVFCGAMAACGAVSLVRADDAAVFRTCAEPMGHHLEYQQHSCPLDGTTFEALTLGTHSTFGSYLDLTEVSYMMFPVPLPICPTNGITVYKSEFTPEEIDKLIAVSQRDDFKSLLSGDNTSWYLFAKLVSMAPLNDVDEWWAYGRAAAEAESCEYDDIVTEYRTEARAVINNELAQTETGDDHFWPMLLSAVNLDRKLGDFRAAATRLDELDSEIPEDWALAFETLKEATERKSTERVVIGAYQEQSNTTK